MPHFMSNPSSVLADRVEHIVAEQAFTIKHRETLPGSSDGLRFIATQPERDICCLIELASHYDRNREECFSTWWNGTRHAVQTFSRQLPAVVKGIVIGFVTTHRLLQPDRVLLRSRLDIETRTLALELAPKTRVNFVAIDVASPPPNFGSPALARDLSETIRFILASPAMTGQVLILEDSCQDTPLNLPLNQSL